MPGKPQNRSFEGITYISTKDFCVLLAGNICHVYSSHRILGHKKSIYVNLTTITSPTSYVASLDKVSCVATTFQVTLHSSTLLLVCIVVLIILNRSYVFCMDITTIWNIYFYFHFTKGLTFLLCEPHHGKTYFICTCENKGAAYQRPCFC